MGELKAHPLTPAMKGYIALCAAALKAATEEHGRPNTFAPGDLTNSFNRRLVFGRIGKHYLYELWQALGGHAGWGSCPTYSNGRFAV